jgi:hypothetical protein
MLNPKSKVSLHNYIRIEIEAASETNAFVAYNLKHQVFLMDYDCQVAY